MKPFYRALRRGTVLGALCSLAASTMADGTETLGPPSIAIAAGSQVLVAGVGLEFTRAGDIELTVPAGVTVQQVLAYWNGFTTNGVGLDATDRITLNGLDVTGVLIGGPNELGFSDQYSGTYRADVTGLGLIGVGANRVAVAGIDFSTSNGAGLLVIVDDGVNTTAIQLRDGDDFAFEGFGNQTVAQDFAFAAATSDRTADLAFFFASVSDFRPTVINISVDGRLVDQVIDAPNDSDGAEWDTLTHSVMIPAGATSATIQALSMDSGIGPFAGRIPASFVWMTSTFTLAPGVCTGSIGDFVWNDMNEDGLQDPGEPGIPNVLVLLKNTGGDILDMSVTNADGLYGFMGLCAGDYKVEVDESTLPMGFVPSPCNVGSDDAIDNDCSPACVTLPTDDAMDDTIDFGYHGVVEVLACRFTGGHNARNKEVEGADFWTTGGQVGAPTESQPQPCGEWTHVQHSGPQGRFVFHGGTNSAPEETHIASVTCSDPPACRPASNPAPAKQLDFAGVGAFRSIGEGPLASNPSVSSTSFHWFEVHIEDLGEPGSQDPGPQCPAGGFAGSTGDCSCPDFYRIAIHEDSTPGSRVIYTAEGYLAGGNFQIHDSIDGGNCRGPLIR